MNRWQPQKDTTIIVEPGTDISEPTVSIAGTNHVLMIEELCKSKNALPREIVEDAVITHPRETLSAFLLVEFGWLQRAGYPGKLAKVINSTAKIH